MTNPTVTMHRDSATVATVTFANPPVNLVVGETVTPLAAIVDELYADPAMQVVVFRSDLAKVDEFPVKDAG